MVGADLVDDGKALSPAGAVALLAIGGGVVWWYDSAECSCDGCSYDGGGSGEDGGDEGGGKMHGC